MVKHFQKQLLRKFPENSCAVPEKAIYSTKKYLPIGYISSYYENSEHPWWSHFNILVILEFP